MIADLLKKAEEQNKRKPEVEAKAEERISYAKARLMKMEPFFAMLLFKMPCYPTYEIPTMATDGLCVIYNPFFVVDTLMRKDVVFVLLHEIAHVFWKHTFRGPIRHVNAKKIFEKRADLAKRGVKDTFIDIEIKKMEHMLKEWNFATDYIINEHLKKNMKVPCSKKLEETMLFDDKFTDMTSEKVYDKIKTPFKMKKDKCSGGGVAGGTGDDDDDLGLGIGGVLPAGFGELTEEEVRAAEADFEGDVQAAAMVAKKAGKLPAGVAEAIESLYTTQTPWQDVFRTIFTSINKQDYTFQYPNKRYTQHMLDYGVVLPSLWGEEYVNVGFIMDTSGSVGREEKQILASELQHILEDYPITIHVLYCDTKAYVDNVQIFTPEDIKNGKLTLDVKGGGGTAMRPAFDYFRDNQEEHQFQTVICMTDMFLFDWGGLGPEPEFSVYWACLPDHDKNAKPDWGTKVEIVLEK